jgi:hypothetical protein
MSILPHYITSSARQKTELRIRKSKCFFLLQLYSLTPTEIDTFRQKIAPLGLRLIRFPVINWKKTSIAFLRTANHLPVQISNYALLGDNPLNPEALSTLNTILHEDQVVLLFGSQENVWFNSQRLGESPK